MLGFGTLSSLSNARAGVVVSRRSMPRNTTPRGDHVSYAVFNAGCSSWQGPHHDAQKISTTGWPWNDVMLTTFPVSVGPPDAVTCCGALAALCGAPQAATSRATAQPNTTRRVLVTAAPPRRSRLTG